MKKLLAVLLTGLILTSFVSGCWRDHDKMSYYAPSQFDTITFDALLEYGGDFAIGYYCSIYMHIGDKWAMSSTFDKNRRGEEANLSEQVVEDFKDILSGQTLYALKMPIEDSDYNYNIYYSRYDKYASEYLAGESSLQKKHLLSVRIPAKATHETPRDAITLCDIGLWMDDKTKCYVTASYLQANDDKHQKEYVYYTEDEQLIENLLGWAETCLELDNAQPYEYD